MFEVKGSAAVATVSELRRDVGRTVEAAHQAPVYLTSDGKPVAAMVSVELLDEIFGLLEDVDDARVAAARLERLRTARSTLLGEEEFWAKVEQRKRG
jgi:prevent-host-death family protein